jgi:hypothetical protein
MSFLCKLKYINYFLEDSAGQNTAKHASLKRHRLTRFERDQMLITSIINSIKGPQTENDPSEDETELLKKMSGDYLWKECVTLLKDYFNIDFLNELKDNKQLIFRLYKLYLLHQLLMRMKAIEDNPNHPVNKKRGANKGGYSLLAPNPVNGEPLIYEEYSDEEADGGGISDLGGEDGG